jgi:ribosomal protein L34E
MKLIEPDTCPRCGKEFHCSKSAKCWCYEVDTSPSLLEEIQKNYDSCLCPDCLKSLNEKSKDKGLADWSK